MLSKLGLGLSKAPTVSSQIEDFSGKPISSNSPFNNNSRLGQVLSMPNKNSLSNSRYTNSLSGRVGPDFVRGGEISFDSAGTAISSAEPVAQPVESNQITVDAEIHAPPPSANVEPTTAAPSVDTSSSPLMDGYSSTYKTPPSGPSRLAHGMSVKDAETLDVFGLESSPINYTYNEAGNVVGPPDESFRDEAPDVTNPENYDDIVPEPALKFSDDGMEGALAESAAEETATTAASSSIFTSAEAGPVGIAGGLLSAGEGMIHNAFMSNERSEVESNIAYMKSPASGYHIGNDQQILNYQAAQSKITSQIDTIHGVTSLIGGFGGGAIADIGTSFIFGGSSGLASYGMNSAPSVNTNSGEIVNPTTSDPTAIPAQ